MNADAANAAPAGESPEEDASYYTMEILSQITGVSTQTILLYEEHGIIRPADESKRLFDDECVRALRRLQHLRDQCEMNLTGLKMLAQLLEEVEQLREELRRRR
ncbi:MAG: MerR family transcriptional regulator [Prosthecobacter sp.]|nr:MerR family transcriptional regulator [Prosthecobacter sp.]